MQIARLSLAALLVALYAAPAQADEPASNSRPNVLWICSDDHAAYVYGAYGNDQVRTPRLDQLAADGMRFDRAYCNSPVCTASRQSFLTGRYPRTIGVTQLRTPLPEDEVTLADALSAAGYRTASIGKTHFNSNLRHGFDVRTDAPEHHRWLKQRGAAPVPAGIETLPVWRPFRDPARVWLNSFYRPYAAVESDMPSAYFADQAAEYLAGDDDDRPFFLMVSFTEPHSPFRFPIEYRNRIDPADMPVPEVDADDDWQIPAIFRDLTREEKQGIVASYYTSVEYLDHSVGRVLDALAASGHADDTLVVYTGDHGYMLGHHGRFEKHCCYEPAVRSPLVVRWPGAVEPGGRTDALVEFIDIAPTLLAACGAPVPAGVQGQSLAPLLRGQESHGRDRVFVEYSENEEAMVRTDRWKLIYSTGQREREDGYATGRPLPGRTVQLFDVANDPEERDNLAGLPEYASQVDELTRSLADHLRRTARQPEIVPDSDDVHVVLAHCLAPRDVAPAR